MTATHFHAEHTTGYAAFSAPAKYINSSIQEAEFAEGGAQQIQLFSGRSPMTAELLKGATARESRYLASIATTYWIWAASASVSSSSGRRTRKATPAIFVEGDNVLFAGDVVMNNSFLAATATSSMKAWLTAFDAFEKLRATVIVPSHGPIGDAIADPAESIGDAGYSDPRARAQEDGTVGGRRGRDGSEGISGEVSELAARERDHRRRRGLTEAP